MRKIWLVAAATYRRRVTSTLFLILTFGIPVLMVIAAGVAVLTQIGGGVPQIGYVDQTGELAAVSGVTVEGRTVPVTMFDSQEEARQALQAGDVGGYLVVPEDYLEEGAATYYGESSPNAVADEALIGLMRLAMLPDAPDWILSRLDDPSDVTYVAQETGERVAQGPALVLRILTPGALAMVFVLSVFTSANQMGAAVVREKEQRAMEMVVTSISPRELVSGKVLGMTLLTATQVGVWMLGAAAGVGLALLGTLQVQELSIPWRSVLWAALLGIPGYFLYAVLGAGLGVIAGDKEQARQLAGVLGFLGMGPLYFMSAIIDNLSGPLGVGLTLFPLTAPTIALFRMTLSEVPTWQLGASLGIILVCLAAAVWSVARIFRAAMLLYGQSLKPKEILQALRHA